MKLNTITKSDLQLYIEDDISYDKKNIIQEIENKFSRNSKLSKDESRIITELNKIRKLDTFFDEAIKNQPSIPKELQNEINKTINFLSNNKTSNLKKIFNFKHFISSMVGAIAAVSAMMLFTVVTPTAVFRDVASKDEKKLKFSTQNNFEALTKNTPNSWLIENDIAFALLSKQKQIDVNGVVKVKLGDTIIFMLIPLISKKVDIKIISNNGEVKELYKNLSIKKGIKFESVEYVMGEPIGTDRLQILENSKVILEKEIIISD